MRVSYLPMISRISWNSSAASTTLYRYLWNIRCFSSFFSSFSRSFVRADVSSFNLKPQRGNLKVNWARNPKELGKDRTSVSLFPFFSFWFHWRTFQKFTSFHVFWNSKRIGKRIRCTWHLLLLSLDTWLHAKCSITPSGTEPDSHLELKVLNTHCTWTAVHTGLVHSARHSQAGTHLSISLSLARFSSRSSFAFFTARALFESFSWRKRCPSQDDWNQILKNKKFMVASLEILVDVWAQQGPLYWNWFTLRNLSNLSKDSFSWYSFLSNSSRLCCKLSIFIWNSCNTAKKTKQMIFLLRVFLTEQSKGQSRPDTHCRLLVNYWANCRFVFGLNMPQHSGKWNQTFSLFGHLLKMLVRWTASRTHFFLRGQSRFHFGHFSSLLQETSGRCQVVVFPLWHLPANTKHRHWSTLDTPNRDLIPVQVEQWSKKDFWEVSRLIKLRANFPGAVSPRPFFVNSTPLRSHLTSFVLLTKTSQKETAEVFVFPLQGTQIRTNLTLLTRGVYPQKLFWSILPNWQKGMAGKGKGMAGKGWEGG